MNVNGAIINQYVVTIEQFFDKNLEKTCLFKNDQFSHCYIQYWLLTIFRNRLETNNIIYKGSFERFVSTPRNFDTFELLSLLLALI